MRTTITLDDDLYQMLEQQARKLSVSLKQMVNDTLRNGLGQNASSSRTPRRFETPVFNASLRAGIDPTKLNQLSDDLETEHFIEKARRDGNL